MWRSYFSLAHLSCCRQTVVFSLCIFSNHSVQQLHWMGKNFFSELYPQFIDSICLVIGRVSKMTCDEKNGNKCGQWRQTFMENIYLCCVITGSGCGISDMWVTWNVCVSLSVASPAACVDGKYLNQMEGKPLWFLLLLNDTCAGLVCDRVLFLILMVLIFKQLFPLALDTSTARSFLSHLHVLCFCLSHN